MDQVFDNDPSMSAVHPLVDDEEKTKDDMSIFTFHEMRKKLSCSEGCKWSKMRL
jgi:hypothetical protein